MTTQEIAQLEKIRSQYKNLESSIDDIKYKLLKKDGFGFIKWHEHKQEKLLNDVTFENINELICIISSNIESWLQYNDISNEFLYHYNTIKNSLEYQIDILKNDIIHREPTFWEIIRDGIQGIFKIHHK